MSEDPTPYNVSVHDSTLPEYEQLAFFDSFGTEQANDSVTLDLYDAFASFPILKKRESEKIQDFVRLIQEAGKSYTVRITQASIRRRGAKNPVGIFPGPRDELIERTLRYMAVKDFTERRLVEDREKGRHISLVFTLSSLRRELENSGNFFTLAQIRESLKILAGSHLEVEAENDESFRGVSSPILSNLTFDYRKGDADGRQSFVAVCFHPLAKTAIETMAYKPIDFQKWARISSPLGRWLVGRMTNRYRQASRAELFDPKGYHLSLATILAESGIHEEKRIRDNIETVRKALAEISEGYLSLMGAFDEELKYGPAKGGRKPIIGAVWTLHPNVKFVEEIIRGNDEMKRRKRNLK